MSSASTLDELARAVERLREQNRQLTEHVTDLEADLQETDARVDTLEAENETLRDETERLRDRLGDCETTTERLEAATDATRKRSGANKERIEELQARELEKGAHLRAANVDRCDLELATDHLERLTKDDGRAYYRLPESEDPLDRGDSVSLAHGDLLPIQQLARMDDEMRRSTTNALPTRLAAKLWKARSDPDVGDNPWRQGCKTVREYVKASDLKHWIRRQESGVSDAYAKKLVSRTIDALLDLSKHRLAVRKQTERKNGLSYTERRVLLPTDADLPGDQPAGSPETADVHG
ncbi:hypothetical protein CV102_18175 [Natronococcus pandeyae]|uniref:Uncharacterized protein n=1 Tax=Natronococcus pandeyae TaxID=2055836 RepID=A0A8J8PYK7_9EURY|nr:hypothetical protein [Natronococcus pandeyae]TYL37241.1 hypothetical protein CV102_18175 [Natronococcus pandeyae]